MGESNKKEGKNKRRTERNLKGKEGQKHEGK